MTRPQFAVSPEADPATDAERPGRSDTTGQRQQAGSVQRNRVSSAAIDHPRTAEQTHRSLTPASPSPTSSEFGNPGGNWLG